MRSLRARLFVAIFGTVLIAVGAALALGVVLTKSAVRDTIRSDVERQADCLAIQFSLLPEEARRQGRNRAQAAPGAKRRRRRGRARPGSGRCPGKDRGRRNRPRSSASNGRKSCSRRAR